MSTVTSAPLGGFEERLLTQLKAHVASQPSPASPPSTIAREVRRIRRRPAVPLLTAVAAAVAAALLILSVLSGSQPALAQAFPLLSGRPHSLSALVKRMLRSERIAESNSWLDDGRAYAFRTRVGAGYVVVSGSSQLLCLVVPGMSGDGESMRCETATQLLASGSSGIGLVATPRDHEEVIVELIHAGAKTKVTEVRGGQPHVALTDGILTVVARRPVTIVTTLNGRQLSTTYDPGAPSTAAAANRLRAPACVASSPSAERCSGHMVPAAATALVRPPRRPSGNCGSAQRGLRSTQALSGRPRSSALSPPGPAKPAACTS
jgi:hypothetical protein